jgi:hypothetical protein
MTDVPQSHQELDAMLTRELAPLMERLAREFSVVTTAVCVVEDSGITSVISCMTPHVARASLKTALAAYDNDSHDA